MNQNSNSHRIVPSDRIYTDNQHNPEGDFINTYFGGMECQGRITEIEHQELFYSKWHKFVNAIFHGEPYQLAHQTIEYTIRVENITSGFPTEVTDFCLYGNYLGRLQVGDEVNIKAKKIRDRQVVSTIYNETTASFVHPGMQIPAWVVRSAFLFILIAIVSLIYEIVWLFQCGAVTAGIIGFLTAFMPILIILYGIWSAIRSVFFPRRRRRY